MKSYWRGRRRRRWRMRMRIRMGMRMMMMIPNISLWHTTPCIQPLAWRLAKARAPATPSVMGEQSFARTVLWVWVRFQFVCSSMRALVQMLKCLWLFSRHFTCASLFCFHTPYWGSPPRLLQPRGCNSWCLKVIWLAGRRTFTQMPALSGCQFVARWFQYLTFTPGPLIKLLQLPAFIGLQYLYPPGIAAPISPTSFPFCPLLLNFYSSHLCAPLGSIHLASISKLPPPLCLSPISCIHLLGLKTSPLAS